MSRGALDRIGAGRSILTNVLALSRGAPNRSGADGSSAGLEGPEPIASGRY
jgi:hypothetical protein